MRNVAITTTKTMLLSAVTLLVLGRTIVLRSPIAAPDLGALWERLRYFVMMSTVLVAWLALRAPGDRRRRRSAERVPQPSSLTIGEEAHWAGVDEKTVGDARSVKVTNVLFRSDGTIAGFEDVSGAAGV